MSLVTIFPFKNVRSNLFLTFHKLIWLL